MATQNVKLPDIGEGVTEGELIKWLVKIGDKVSADQPVAEVMTDKASVEVPSPYPGVIKEFKFKEGDVIPIETVIAVLDGAGGEAPAPEKKVAPETSKPAPATVQTQRAPDSEPGTFLPAAKSNVLATPATRRLARETGVDINQLSGSGLAGRVTREDVLSAQGGAGEKAQGSVQGTSSSKGSTTSTGMMTLQVPKPSVISPPGAMDERVPLRGIRKKIAENMQMAKHIIPHFTIVEEACVDQLVETRGQAKVAAEKFGVKVTYLPYVMKALIATCREFPSFNASIDDQAAEIVYKKYFNIGFAADTPNGLMVPVIKNADFKTVLQISQEIGGLAVKAREGKLALDDMKGATITVTNIGSVGGLYATPIINHPEVAILGMYKIQDKPKWNGSEFVRASYMNFSMTCDHRLIDGAVAANFMKAFISRIENPSQLMLDMI